MKYWNKARLKTRRTNSKSCSSMLNVKGTKRLFGSPTPSSFVENTFLSWAYSTPGLQFSSTDTPWLWHLQYLEVFNPSLASLSQFHGMTSWASTQRLLCHNTLPQWLSFALEDFTPPLLLYPS